MGGNASNARIPMVTIFPACCARAASGHAAAAPPSAASNSRRPMVTVIRPSRARCVKGTYHATSVLSLTARHPARAARLDFKRFIFDHAVGRALINAGIGRMSALGANRTRRDGGNDVNDPNQTLSTPDPTPVQFGSNSTHVLLECSILPAVLALGVARARPPAWRWKCCRAATGCQRPGTPDRN